jgi:hypothetical protein
MVVSVGGGGDGGGHGGGRVQEAQLIVQGGSPREDVVVLDVNGELTFWSATS